MEGSTMNEGTMGLASQRYGLLVGIAALFWAFAYILYSARAGLAYESFDLIDDRRAFATGAGALVLLVALRTRATGNRPRRPLVEIIQWTLASVIAVLVVRLIYDQISFGEIDSPNDHALWLLVWTGYFAAWFVAAPAAVAKADSFPPANSQRSEAPLTHSRTASQGGGRFLYLTAVAVGVFAPPLIAYFLFTANWLALAVVAAVLSLLIAVLVAWAIRMFNLWIET